MWLNEQKFCNVHEFTECRVDNDFSSLLPLSLLDFGYGAKRLTFSFLFHFISPLCSRLFVTKGHGSFISLLDFFSDFMVLEDFPLLSPQTNFICFSMLNIVPLKICSHTH